MRTFIQYDEDGEIIAVLQTEALAEGIEQPFYLEDEKHGAAEITGDAAISERAAAELGEGFRFDAAKRKLVKKSAPKAAAKETVVQEEAAAKKSDATKLSAKKSGAKKTGAKKSGAKKSKRSSGAK
ncbi:MAG TPA: hypothetical protein VFS10_19865 [Pyrinomonadaceae bacterium]|nr:hypothetical protein [Pyrinomonadaceae bacterium]